MKKKLLVLLSMAVILAFVGCGATDDDETKTNAGTDAAGVTTVSPDGTTNGSEDKTDASETSKNEDGSTENKEETSTSKESSTDKEEPTTKYTGEYSEFDTTIMEYGVGNRRLEDGRYEGPIYCANLYKGYNVEFCKENEKVIYLTFDEGYENGYTPKILDVLKEKKVCAVFFVTMDFAKSEPDLIQRIIDDGHVLANHTVSHPSMPELTPAEQKEELMVLHNYIKDKYGYEMYLHRPPMGKISKQSVKVADDCGYKTVLWSFAYYDYDTSKQPTKEEALEIMTSRLHNGGLYLLHAVSSANTAALGDFIDAARAQGYTFVEYTK